MPTTDEPAATWTAAADERRRIGRSVEFHARIGSTNDRARALLEGGTEGVAVVTDLQTAGRGRRGRTWLSPAGASLMCSVGVRPRLAAADAGLLAAAAALAVRDACGAVADLAVRWPNDLVAPGDGAKVAGLLIETSVVEGRLAEAVIGTGINADWSRDAMPDEIRGGATSLGELSGASVDRVALLRRLLDALEREVAALEGGASPIARLRAASWLDGRFVTVDAGDAMVAGRVAGIAADGSLLLDTDRGRVALGYGEVVRLRAATEVPA